MTIITSTLIQPQNGMTHVLQFQQLQRTNFCFSLAVAAAVRPQEERTASTLEAGLQKQKKKKTPLT